MSINHLILRNLKKNLKSYYLYVFALIFTVGLYFAFVTLQFDSALDVTKGSIKGAASIKAASVLLVAIVSVFLLYANNIFIKRRSKEIGLFQLIGMTKNRIFRILTIENFILYFSSLVIGILVGFSFSKLIMMILLKITEINRVAELHFSGQAFVQTLFVFSAIYVLIMLMNYTFIKRQTILSLFRVTSSTEEQVKKVSKVEIVIGIIGILFIGAGYYISSKLFSGAFTTINELFGAMIGILALVIIGTYLFYKGSVRYIFHLIRKRKDGYLNINQVLSLSSIMFRMKSNALLLTVITTVSALAIGLLSLSYISYYSIERNAEAHVGADFSFIAQEDSNLFQEELEKAHISYDKKEIEVIQAEANMQLIMETTLEELNFDPTNTPIPVISDNAVENVNLASKEVILTGFSDDLGSFMTLDTSGEIELKGRNETFMLNYLGLEKDYVVSFYFTSDGLPVAVVDESVFNELKNDINSDIQLESSLFIGFNIKDDENFEKANDIYNEVPFNNERFHGSLLEKSRGQKEFIGLQMFIVGFLGLTFLITSGCILYFKQMDESEDEKPNYTILRKLGFTQGDLVKGIQGKQIFNFGIPLSVGLLHSYFAVKSGWFFFGTELWAPMLIVMVLYTGLYSIFGMLSVLYYKKVIQEAL